MSLTEEEWGDFKRGDPVKIAGVKGSWVFIAHVTTPSGNTWVNVYGGAKSIAGVRKYRSVDPEKVSKVSK